MFSFCFIKISSPKTILTNAQRKASKKTISFMISVLKFEKAHLPQFDYRIRDENKIFTGDNSRDCLHGDVIAEK